MNRMKTFEKWLEMTKLGLDRDPELAEAIKKAKNSLQYQQGIPMSVFRDQDGYYVLEARPDDATRPEFVQTVSQDDAGPQL
jgi:hypothetical protein